jgi:hypothetical protein
MEYSFYDSTKMALFHKVVLDLLTYRYTPPHHFHHFLNIVNVPVLVFKKMRLRGAHRHQNSSEKIN